MTRYERQNFSHQTLGSADEPIGLTRLLAHSTSLVDDVAVLIGLTKRGDFGIAIYDAGALHRFRVLEIAFVKSCLAKSRSDLYPLDAFEIANYKVAMGIENDKVRARFWWVMDWGKDIIRYQGGDRDAAHHLLDVEFPVSELGER